MFLDEATINVRGGDGGRGCVSWRREAFVPKGGPDGGDGGRGGAVIVIANENTDTLSDFASRKRFAAENGEAGSGKKRHGKDGMDLLLLVPPGTLIHSDSTLVADLARTGDRCTVARGGRGGYGNAHFVSSVRQRPDFAELGEPGEKRTIKLELKLVADVGIIGLPNVGKSTLISAISAARPKIANYPFTTLVPNLGVALIGDRAFTLCDIPGLIEGASVGKGLGVAFLRHVERCGVLLHLLDLSRAICEGGEIALHTLIADYRTIRAELSAHSPALAGKRELVVLNKTDILGNDRARIRAVTQSLNKEGIAISAAISAATHAGTEELKEKLLPIVLREREVNRGAEVTAQAPASDAPLPVLRPDISSPRMGAYRIERGNDGSVVVRGERIEQFAVMTDFESTGAMQRFHDVINRIGLAQGLRRLHLPPGTSIFIGRTRIDPHLDLPSSP